MKKVKKRIMLFTMLFMGILVGLQLTSASVEAASPSMNKKAITIYVGKKQELILKDFNGKVTWKSSKASVAPVTADGTVTGKKAGNTIITATAGGKNYKCNVTVKNIAVSKITLSKKEYTLEVGDKYTLKANISPANATIKTVIWSSSNTNTATISAKGAVTAVSEGTSIITATTKDGKVQSSCTITVTSKTPANAVNMEIITSDGGEFIYGMNTMNFNFELDNVAKGVTVDIVDALDNSVKKFKLGNIKSAALTSVKWDGINESKKAVNGIFRVKVKAKDTETFSDYFTLYSSSPFGKGNGSKDSPYMVSSIDELIQIQKHNGYYFKQDVDIDFAYDTLNSLFSADAPFGGTFDGNGFTISNLLGNAPIFHTIGKNGKITDLKIVNCSVSASSSIALLTQNNYGTISNCDVQGTVTVHTRNPHAGLYAIDNYGTISNCKASGIVMASGQVESNAGGMVCSNNDGAKIIQCSSYVDVTATSETYCYNSNAGGITSYNRGGAYIVNTTSYGSIVANTVKDTENYKHPAGIAVGNDGQIVNSSYLGKAQIDLTAWGSGLVK